MQTLPSLLIPPQTSLRLFPEIPKSPLYFFRISPHNYLLFLNLPGVSGSPPLETPLFACLVIKHSLTRTKIPYVFPDRLTPTSNQRPPVTTLITLERWEIIFTVSSLSFSVFFPPKLTSFPFFFFLRCNLFGFVFFSFFLNPTLRSFFPRFPWMKWSPSHFAVLSHSCLDDGSADSFFFFFSFRGRCLVTWRGNFFLWCLLFQDFSLLSDIDPVPFFLPPTTLLTLLN